MHTTAGWECPRCHAVWSPGVTGCLNCPVTLPAWPQTIGIGPPQTIGGSCTCTAFGPGTALCPVHVSYRSRVICLWAAPW